MKEIRNLSDSNEKKQTYELITNLLTQAEQCKAQVNPVRSAPCPIAEIMRPEPFYKISEPVHPIVQSHLNPSKPNTKISNKPDNKTKNIEDPLEKMIESEIIDVSKSVN